MNKEDLKYGNVVETGDGERYLFTYHDEKDIFVGLTGDGYYYVDSLRFDNNCNNSLIVIMKIYKNYACKEILWERKEKPKLTYDEKVILKNISKEYKWIARDKNGRLFLYIEKERITKGGDHWHTDGGFLDFHMFDNLFQFIKWEDEEPYNIEDLLKEGDENE